MEVVPDVSLLEDSWARLGRGARQKELQCKKAFRDLILFLEAQMGSPLSRGFPTHPEPCLGSFLLLSLSLQLLVLLLLPSFLFP